MDFNEPSNFKTFLFHEKEEEKKPYPNINKILDNHTNYTTKTQILKSIHKANTL